MNGVYVAVYTWITGPVVANKADGTILSISEFSYVNRFLLTANGVVVIELLWRIHTVGMVVIAAYVQQSRLVEPSRVLQFIVIARIMDKFKKSEYNFHSSSMSPPME